MSFDRRIFFSLAMTVAACSSSASDVLLADDVADVASSPDSIAGDSTPSDGAVPLAPPGAACQDAAGCATGFCVDGVCCESACDGVCSSCAALDTGVTSGTCAPVLRLTDPADECGSDEAACLPGVCDGAGACIVAAEGEVCRVASGACDAPEVCSGGTCPADQVLAAGTICRPAEDNCDIADLCDGVSVSCGDDLFEAPGTLCRPAAGDCDVAELCPGDGAQCPDDALAATDVICRDAAGACDAAETCSGDSKTCPPDALHSETQVCRESTGACDPAENCDGTNLECPADALSPVGTECRVSVGECDRTELCQGGPECPPDGFVGPDIVCRADLGPCDVEEVCPGDSVSCPPDVVVVAGTVCREDLGPCDVEEACTGASGVCPDDLYEAVGTTCRDAAGDCDVAETCTGGASCPDDALIAAGSPCRDAQGLCDVAEACTGSSVSCPADLIAPEGTVCRDERTTCDAVELCSGSSIDCPADAPKGEGVVCREAFGPCDVAELCPGGSFDCPSDAVAPASSSACAPYACSGVDSECATSCVFDSDCAASDYRAVCTNGECVTGRIAFVSSTLFDPSTGITSADAKCNALAQAQGLSGEYRAWMSTNAVSASQRIDHSTVPFVLRVGATGRVGLAYDWADLTDGSLARAFDRNEKGQGVATGDYVLTGTDRAGATTTKTCANWTTKVGSATYGSTAFLTKNWTEYIFGLSCSEPGYIYCFETTGDGAVD